MKIDGTIIAKEALERRAKDKNHNFGGEVLDETVLKGSHLKDMASFLEAVKLHDPKKAHEHMEKYIKSLRNLTERVEDDPDMDRDGVF